MRAWSITEPGSRHSLWRLISRLGRSHVPAILAALLVAGCRSGTDDALDAAWPNEPSGFRVINDYGFDDPIPVGNGVPVGSSGWAVINDSGATRVTDPSAPRSPPDVLHITFPTGFTGGVAPVTMWYDFPATRPRELYVGFWLKVSNPWQGHSSGVNKIAYITTGGTQDALIPELFGQAAPYRLRMAVFELGASQNPVYGGWLDPNVEDVTPTLGAWHRIEIYAKYGTSSTSNDGIVRVWMDRTLMMSYSDINFAHDGFDGWKLSPTWGGIGDTKREDDSFWFDHVHASGR